MGNSPPARKRAVSPLTAVRLGSASRCTRPTCSSALRMPWPLFGQILLLELVVVLTCGVPAVVVTLVVVPLVVTVKFGGTMVLPTCVGILLTLVDPVAPLV